MSIALIRFRPSAQTVIVQARPPRPASSRIRGVRRRVAGASLLLALSLLLAACGYRQDVPALPGGARSVSLEAIRNRTDVAELDVRLHAELTRRLARQAHVALLPSEDPGGLRLSIVLEQATLVRTLDTAQTGDRAFAYTLVGHMTLLDPRSGIRHVDAEPLTVSRSVYRDASVLETPGVRDAGWQRVLAAFAEQVERRLLRAF